MDPLTWFTISAIGSITYTRRSWEDRNCEKVYHGCCHCGKVTFEVKSTKHLVVWDCNCSVCLMKKNWHFIVPENNFKLLSGSDDLTTYTFNTNVAKHMFCSTCGVQAFYRPRSNPDGYAVTFACISPDQTSLSYEIVKFDGSDWEGFYGKSGIQKFSKQ